METSWKEEGEKMQVEVLNKIESKLKDGRPLTGFERSFYRKEVGEGHIDFIPGRDDGEEKVIKYQE